MKSLFQYLVLSLPLFVNAQKDCSGIWKLKTKTSISGPDYDNGIPAIIKINQHENVFEIQATYFSNGKYYNESDVVVGDSTLESITETKRKKKVCLSWDSAFQTWKMQLEWFAKDDFTKPEIRIEQLINATSNPNELSFKKTYAGATIPGGNKDYNMSGIYEKTSSEKLALDTARGNGIKFIEGLSWQQIVDLARKENKFIFVDCYATWCLPCKKMDNEVYSLNVVGEAVNEKFISLRVQMDTSAKDNEAIKLTYPMARRFEKEFNIKALPSFLFFDSTGKIVDRGMGAQTYEYFIKTVNEARDSSLQIYSLFRKAEKGELTPKQVRELTDKIGWKCRDNNLIKALVRNYLDNYLQKLSSDSFLSVANIKYINKYRFAVNSTDRVFKFWFNNSKKIDSIEGQKGAAADFVQSVIANEEISKYFEDAIKTKQVPNWVQIEKTIAKKFGNYYATRCIVNAKVGWYRFTKEWKLYCKYLVQQVKLNEFNHSWFYLNLAAWDIFLHSNNKAQLEIALKWSDKAMKLHEIEEKKPDVQSMDTYANLLYKLGRVDEAISFEQRVIELVPSEEFKTTLDKMKRGLKTWAE